MSLSAHGMFVIVFDNSFVSCANLSKIFSGWRIITGRRKLTLTTSYPQNNKEKKNESKEERIKRRWVDLRKKGGFKKKWI